MKPYYEISKKSTIYKELQDFAFSPSEWQEYYNFQAKLIPHELLFQDEFLRNLFGDYKFIGGVLKMDPYTCYDWHTDTRRGVGINMLLTPPTQRQTCVFKIAEGYPVFEIEELRYKPSTYYLFNTQVPHTVYNFETTRYLLSIEFAKDKDELSYEKLLKEVMAKYE